MSTAELRRGPAAETAEPLDLSRAIALKAEAVLGYCWLRKRLHIEPGSLSRALDELGIEPLCPEDVKRYKKEKSHAATDHALREIAGRVLSNPLALDYYPEFYVAAKWRSTPLRKYKGEVPEFALSHALEIKERVPGVEFEVEVLSVDIYDPFLIACCGKERFYIDVWDERDFEKQQCI